MRSKVATKPCRSHVTVSLSRAPLFEMRFKPDALKDAVSAKLQEFFDAVKDAVDEFNETRVNEDDYSTLEDCGLSRDWMTTTAPLIGNYVLDRFPKAEEELLEALIYEGVWYTGAGEQALTAADVASILSMHRRAVWDRVRAKDRRGGSRPVLNTTDAESIQLVKAYRELLKHWQKISGLYLENPEGDWREKAKLDQPDTPNWLLNDLQIKTHHKCRPHRLAHYHAATRCRIDIQTPKGKLVSLRTLERLRRRGELLSRSATSANQKNKSHCRKPLT